MKNDCREEGIRIPTFQSASRHQPWLIVSTLDYLYFFIKSLTRCLFKFFSFFSSKTAADRFGFSIRHFSSQGMYGDVADS